ncbi:MAG: ATP-binding protein, partial [Gammaproteobacteria bacterium]
MNKMPTDLYLKNILNAKLPVSLYWMNQDGVMLGCNEEQAHMLGLSSSKELIGKSVYDFVEMLGWSNEMCEIIRQNDLEVMETKNPIITEEVLEINGQKRTYLSHKSPLLDDNGKVIGVFGFSSDITKRKEAELALKAAKQAAETAREVAEEESLTKIEFVSNMGHDLKMLLESIMGMADQINLVSLDKTTQECAQGIHQAGDALVNLLNEFVETTRLELSDMLYNESCFELKASVKKLIDIFNPAIKQKGLAFEFNYDDHIPEVLYGQKLLFERIILNLLGNALKYTADGMIGIEISLLENKSNMVTIKLVIKDTGIGIPKDQQKNIFDKFNRASIADADYRGNGLGLYMANEFVKKLNGDIKVESVQGNGSKFICKLQFHIPTSTQLVKHQENYKATAKKIHVLLFEETLLARKVAQSLLWQEGYDVTIAKTASEVLELSNQDTFDLILMDVGFADADVLNVVKSIRNQPENRNQKTLIVALAAHADTKINQACLDVGMQEVIDKPLNSKKISVIIANIAPVIDLAAVAEVLGGNMDLAQEMLDMLMQELPKFKQDIRIAFQNQDLEALQHHVHKLHGGLCYSGTLYLRDVTRLFENQLIEKTGHYEEAYHLLLKEIDK